MHLIENPFFPIGLVHMYALQLSVRGKGNYCILAPSHLCMGVFTHTAIRIQPDALFTLHVAGTCVPAHDFVCAILTRKHVAHSAAYVRLSLFCRDSHILFFWCAIQDKWHPNTHHAVCRSLESKSPICEQGLKVHLKMMAQSLFFYL